MTDNTGSPDTLDERARQLATGLSVHRQPGRPRRFRRRVANLRSELRDAVERLVTSSVPSTAIAAEWLLDNEHLVLRAADQVGVDLPVGYYRVLPKTGEGDAPTRVERLARESLVPSQGFVDVPLVQRFVRAFQSVAALDIGELWAIPAFLRLLVVEDAIAAAKSAVRPEPGCDTNERMAAAVGSLRVLDGGEWKESSSRSRSSIVT